MTAPGDESGSRVWCSTEFKLNLGNYESVTISIGASAPCADTPAARKRMQRQLTRTHNAMVAAEVENLRIRWGNSDS